MISVWKFPLQVKDSQEVSMPAGANVLSVQAQHGVPCVWAICDSAEPRRSTRTFRTYGTGQPVDECRSLRFIGTYQLEGGAFVGHVFEVGAV